MTPIGPITPEERINSLDTLRGFALLGILPANVLVFGMYFAAGNDPAVAGGATGLNLASWALFRILIEGKMRCLFSMVFGASMILLTSRVEERSAGSKCRRRWPRGASGTETESAHTKRTGTGCRPKKAGMRAPGRTGAAKGSAGSRCRRRWPRSAPPPVVDVGGGGPGALLDPRGQQDHAGSEGHREEAAHLAPDQDAKQRPTGQV